MIVERASNGDFIVESSEIAERFGLSLSEFRRYMHLGHVTSSVEVGSAAHEGTTRLSLRFGNRFWRAVLNGEDEVQQEETGFLPGKKLGRALL